MMRVFFAVFAFTVLQSVAATKISVDGPSTRIRCPPYNKDTQNPLPISPLPISQIEDFEVTGWNHRNIFPVAVCMIQNGTFTVCERSDESTLSLEIQLPRVGILSPPLTASFEFLRFGNLYCHIFPAIQILQHIGANPIEGAKVRASVTLSGRPDTSDPTFYVSLRAASYIATKNEFTFDVDQGFHPIHSVRFEAPISKLAVAKLLGSVSSVNVEKTTYHFTTERGKPPKYVEEGVPWTDGDFSVTDFVYPISCEVDPPFTTENSGSKKSAFTLIHAAECTLPVHQSLTVTIPAAPTTTTAPTCPPPDTSSCEDASQKRRCRPRPVEDSNAFYGLSMSFILAVVVLDLLVAG